MKYKEDRPLANLDAAVNKLMQIANGMEAAGPRRTIGGSARSTRNSSTGGSVQDYTAAVRAAIDRG